MEYKDTLNLPQTTLEMRANATQKEPKTQEFWEGINVYEKNLAQRDKANSFVLHDGPPYLSSDKIHVGTALNKILKDIKEKCFEMQVFEWDYSYKVLDYAKNKYNSDAEYLWEKFPRNAVCRRNDNQKWFLAILSVKGSNIGLNTDEIVELIDLRATTEEVEKLTATPNYYPAYHMNKKHWFTIVLDGSVKIEKIYEYIDKSYDLAKK